MNQGGPDAVQMALISGVVTGFIKAIQTTNPGGIAPRTALIIAAVVSFLGVAAWVVSQPVLPDRTWTLGLMGAWTQTLLGGLGLLVGASAISAGSTVNAALSGTGSGAPPPKPAAPSPSAPSRVSRY